MFAESTLQPAFLLLLLWASRRWQLSRLRSKGGSAVTSATTTTTKLDGLSRSRVSWRCWCTVVLWVACSVPIVCPPGALWETVGVIRCILFRNWSTPKSVVAVAFHAVWSARCLDAISKPVWRAVFAAWVSGVAPRASAVAAIAGVDSVVRLVVSMLTVARASVLTANGRFRGIASIVTLTGWSIGVLAVLVVVAICSTIAVVASYLGLRLASWSWATNVASSATGILVAGIVTLCIVLADCILRRTLLLFLPDLVADLRLYPPSIAFSNERMVSSGRSQRGRVGFERSGSAVQWSARRVLYVEITLGEISLIMFPVASLCCIPRMESRVVCSNVASACGSSAFRGSNILVGRAMVK